MHQPVWPEPAIIMLIDWLTVCLSQEKGKPWKADPFIWLVTLLNGVKHVLSKRSPLGLNE